MRRTSHKHGSLKRADRGKGKVWEFRWREVQIDGSVCRKNIVVGTLQEFPTESAAQSAVDAIRLTINRQTLQQLLKNVSVETLVKHYQEHELPDIFSIIKAGVKKAIVAIDLKIQRLQNKTIWLQNAEKILENKMSELKSPQIWMPGLFFFTRSQTLDPRSDRTSHSDHAANASLFSIKYGDTDECE